jgi:hypothetical protein
MLDLSVEATSSKKAQMNNLEEDNAKKINENLSFAGQPTSGQLQSANFV